MRVYLGTYVSWRILEVVLPVGDQLALKNIDWLSKMTQDTCFICLYLTKHQNNIEKQKQREEQHINL